MGNVWQLQEAKNRLSELIQKAVRSEPQTITVRGKPAVVVLSVEEYERLTQPKTNLVEFFRNSPLVDVDLDMERKGDAPREVEW
ncbi:type II toxin-antitoxin system prevent-host-death family antitoxin [Kyrpidia spormannii]|uniref:Antitoxin n=1 Tax=Kyrpidia spormannii TaxID=2055160 RepID=A0A2K8N9I1_9BACL|nr:type II toxin-antitoxin system Phd/YefM family antitoxin [Kyrpidia spormannii]ATY85974.1 type II toxin-antitoxin system prevent-host-death family antitoxin [Kyrpidia spormannii]